MIEKFFEYFHTIRFLKLSQIIRRILRRFKITNTSAQNLIDRRDLINDWYEIRIAELHIFDKSSFVFLNKRHDYLGPIDWNDSNQETLWLFNLH